MTERHAAAPDDEQAQRKPFLAHLVWTASGSLE